MEEKVTQVTLSTVKSMGFSDRLIKLLLPDPRLVDNPYYKCAAPMKLWNLEDVNEAMTREEFVEYQEKRKKRVKAAAKAVKTKTDNLIAQVEKEIENIKVSRISIPDLRRRTLQAKQDWYDWCEDFYRGDYRDVHGADKETVFRWMVNYIRHNMTDYDYELYSISKKTGKRDAYLILFEGIMTKIGETYPELQDECKRQVEEKKECYEFSW